MTTNSTTRQNTMRIERMRAPGFEDVRLAEDPSTGLRSIIAVHDTRLGPALGGTRFLPYATVEDALDDAKRLSAAMTYKAAAAGLALGGGKAVIIGDPAVAKTPDLIKAYGRFVDSFHGRYIAAADVGTTTADLDMMGTTTPHVVGRSSEAGGYGDSGYSTALGVLVCMRAAMRLSRNCTLEGVRVGVEGVGKVGSQLVPMLLRQGAVVTVSETQTAARQTFLTRFPAVEIVDDVLTAEVDVYAPCGLGLTLTPDTARTVRASVICGAANNQLDGDDVALALVERRKLWVPDYIANAGGLIQVAAEREGRPLQEAREKIHQLGDVLAEVLHRAAREGVSPAAAANSLAVERLSALVRRSRGAEATTEGL